MHTTNYLNTFIAVAEDCPVEKGELPPQKEDPTVANLQFSMIYDHPYKYTSDDVIFSTYATRNQIPKNEWQEARELFFAKGQACLRSSPLTKRYGWGVHNDAKGRVAIFAQDSPEYKKFTKDISLKHVKAMRSKKGA
jgi:Family of unknown function (DUF6157)